MKIWSSLNRNPANRCRESCALWSSFPVAYVFKIFLGKLRSLACHNVSKFSQLTKKGKGYFATEDP